MACLPHCNYRKELSWCMIKLPKISAGYKTDIPSHGHVMGYTVVFVQINEQNFQQKFSRMYYLRNALYKT